MNTNPAGTLVGTTVGRFRITARLGSGGMGEVYAAEDPTLQRRVALKRVGPRLAHDPGAAQRMTREAQRASVLSHPGLAGIYDVLQHEGDVFIVMEYVEGITLRARLAQKMSPAELLPIVRQCADALHAAHEKGIVHGDVKPENVMIGVGGHIKLLDFGVARRMATADNPEVAETATAMHGWAGTPGYMAPELLLQNIADGRADLFSLGVILYEGLTGIQPFRGDTAMRSADRTLHVEPPTIYEVNTSLPKPLAAIVQKLLAKQPEARYATGRDLVADLDAYEQGRGISARLRSRLRVPRPLVAAALLLLIAAAVAVGVRRFWPAESVVPLASSAQPRFLALVPLQLANPSNSQSASSPEDLAFVNGLTEYLTAQLARITAAQPLQVAPADEVRSAALNDPARARESLGVNVVVTGDFSRSAEQARVDLSIRDVVSDKIVAQRVVTAASGDSFALVDNVARAITQAVGARLTPDEAAWLSEHPTRDRAAFLDFLVGEGYRVSDSAQSVDGAIDAYRHAIAADSHFAAAYAGLGLAYLRKFNGEHDPAVLQQAAEQCRHAVAIDARSATALRCLGNIDFASAKYASAAALFQNAIDADPTIDDAYTKLARSYQRLGQLAKAEATFRQAVQARPNYWWPHSWLGQYYISIGRYADAVREYKRATELAPEKASAYTGLGGAYIYEGDYDAAIAALNRGLAIHATAEQYSNLGTAYLNLHRYDKAVEAFQKASGMKAADYILLGNIARAYYWAGDRERARSLYRDAIRLAEQAKKVAPSNADAPMLLADFYALLDDRAAAVRNLQQARTIDAENSELWFFTGIVECHFGEQAQAIHSLEHALALGYSRAEVRSAPEFEPLHSNAAFQALVRAQ